VWRWPPTPSSTEVKERVELYHYYPSGVSWLFHGEFHLFLPNSICTCFRSTPAVSTFQWPKGCPFVTPPVSTHSICTYFTWDLVHISTEERPCRIIIFFSLSG
jgi:hypothetical protein